MIVEERIYVLHTHCNVADYLKVYESEGMDVQMPILGACLGYFVCEVGTLNQLVHLWGYRDMVDRQLRRDRLAAEPRWQSCLAKLRPMIRTMENRILVPTHFSPLRELSLTP